MHGGVGGEYPQNFASNFLFAMLNCYAVHSMNPIHIPIHIFLAREVLLTSAMPRHTALLQV